MSFHDIVIGEVEFSQMTDCLKAFLRESQGKCAILVDRDGQMLAKQGFTQHLDTTSLAALAAGAIASTQEIARLLGEPEFSVLFHQGQRDHIHFSLIGQRAILMTVFDDRTTIGLIRMLSSRTAEALRRVLEGSADDLVLDDAFTPAGVTNELDRVMGVEG